METQKPYLILLYYKFVKIDNPEEFASEHLEYCKNLGLKGRILVSKEGINGTVSGTVEQTQQYMDHMHQDPRFADLWFKIDEADQRAFQKMFVRLKDELVTFRVEDAPAPYEKTGKYLNPEEFYEALQDEDVIVIDGRNDYEYDIGHFRGAIRPDVKSFREFPEWIRENLGQFKDKKIITYCTGGVRCEKLTGWMVDEGFKDVAQLHGGVVTYGKDPKVKGRLWDGKLYVFDERISVPVNRTDEDVVIGKCHYCAEPEDRYINCAYPPCNKKIIAHSHCEEEHNSYCSAECEKQHQQQLDEVVG